MAGKRIEKKNSIPSADFWWNVKLDHVSLGVNQEHLVMAIPWYTFLYLFLSQTCCWLFICITVVTWLCCSIDCATWYMFPVVNEMIYVSLWSLILLVNQFRPMLWVNAEVIVIRTPAIECIGWWVLLNTFYLSQNACCQFIRLQ